MTGALNILWTVTKGAWLTAAAILLIRLLFRKVLTAKAKYYLWLLLALRLLLPVVPESPLSLLNLLPAPESNVVTELEGGPAVPNDPIWLEADPEMNFAPVSPGTAPASNVVSEVPEIPAAPTRTELLFWFWLGGAIVMLTIYGTLYIVTVVRLSRLPYCTDSETLRVFLRLKKSCGVKRNLRLVSGGAGMLGGLLRPTLVLPVERHGEDVAPIILHELQHFKSGDLWLSALYRLLTAVYWFNPVIWICFHMARQDGEAACDQRVLETGLIAPGKYASVLYEEGVLNMKKGILMQTTFGGDRHSIKRRIRFIAAFRSPKVWMTVMTVVLALMVTACTMTAAQSGSADVPENPAEETASAVETPEPTSMEEPEKNTAYNPYVQNADTMNYENTTWDMTASDAMAAQNLDMDIWRYSDEGKPVIRAENPFPEHPEVQEILYYFDFRMVDLKKALCRVETVYNKNEITFEELVAQRTEELGEPYYIDETHAFWHSGGEAELQIYGGSTLKERLDSFETRYDVTMLADVEGVDVGAYIDALQPPIGHFGWTLEQHVEAGLLDLDQGTIEQTDIALYFETEVELGGYTLDAMYVFIETLAGQGSGNYVLSEIHVDPPNDIGMSKWIEQFEGSWSDFMLKNNNMSYYWQSVIKVGPLLTERQKEYIAQALVDYAEDMYKTEGYACSTIDEALNYLNQWNLAANFYEPARGWVFNGTGIALYTVAQTIE